MVGMMTTAILGSLSLLFWTGGSTWLGGGSVWRLPTEAGCSCVRSGDDPRWGTWCRRSAPSSAGIEPIHEGLEVFI